MSRSTSPVAKQAAARLGRPSAEQSREKMEEVLRVARREFVKQGYRATTMDAIAAAADVAKRTLYMWHQDKAALFLACIMEGARRFPALGIDPHEDVEIGLREYATALVRELTAEFSYGMGLLIIREARDFPELARASEEAQKTYMVEPLAAYLRARGLERPGSVQRTRLLIALILVEVHEALLSGGPPPQPARAERRARLGVDLFLRGARSVPPE